MLSSLEFQVVVPTAAHFMNHMVKANLCENPRHVEVSWRPNWCVLLFAALNRDCDELNM